MPAKFFTWIPAYDNTGKTMKFRLMEWTADAGGTPWTNFGKDHEVAACAWGQPGVKTLHPFRSGDGSTT